MVLKNRSNEIRSNEIRIRRELPVHRKNIQNLSKKWYEFKFNFKKKSLHCAKDEREGPSRVLIRESLLK